MGKIRDEFLIVLPFLLLSITASHLLFSPLVKLKSLYDGRKDLF
jgi:hypothetical protein